MPQGPKEVPSIPSVKSSDVCYNPLSLSAKHRNHQDLGERCHFRVQITALLLPLLLLLILSFVPSVASFFYSLSYFSYGSSLFGLFSFSSSSFQPPTLKAEAVFSPQTSILHNQTTRFDKPRKYHSYVVIFTGECHYVWQHKLCNGFFTEQKTKHRYRFCLHGPLTTHAFRRYRGWTEFGRETWLDLMVETQDVYKLRFNVVTSSNSTEASHFPNRLRFLPTKLYELDGSDECIWPLCYDCEREG